ncbi:uncharacterized protein CDAR_586181 [Caerostris darwini]|uniref:Programmed cell death protein 7 n=1 Tax=Caerostris darwini TaxID=1538125 RepID=A0AAV4VDN4_9ARAC|nr:uncharacterized protein CDAR_586181 [Caerostris darwini]
MASNGSTFFPNSQNAPYMMHNFPQSFIHHPPPGNIYSGNANETVSNGQTTVQINCDANRNYAARNDFYNNNSLSCHQPLMNPAPFQNMQTFPNSNFHVPPYFNVTAPLQNAASFYPPPRPVVNIPPPPIPVPPSPYISSDCTQNSSANPAVNNLPPIQTAFINSLNSDGYNTMSKIITDIQTSTTSTNDAPSVKEKSLNEFLQKFHSKKKDKLNAVTTVQQFRSKIKTCFSMYKMLQSRRERLHSLLYSDQEEWEMEFKEAKELQKKLSEMCASMPNSVNAVQKRLKATKRNRDLKKKLRKADLCHKTLKEQKREKLHQDIDKWLDNLKEKNEKLKRETEMKKEADSILSEVRKKIFEAKKALEKIKLFEKLRSARQNNAKQKGLVVVSKHNTHFEDKMTFLHKTMQIQLSNYEQEERALQVMLETEQEDRREEEVSWRRKKLLALQKKRQNGILESLFGHEGNPMCKGIVVDIFWKVFIGEIGLHNMLKNPGQSIFQPLSIYFLQVYRIFHFFQHVTFEITEEPAPDDPLFLFHQHHTSANKSINNLLQIRHQWDVYLTETGESIPLHWIAPVAPTSVAWENVCTV